MLSRGQLSDTLTDDLANVITDDLGNPIDLT